MCKQVMSMWSEARSRPTGVTTSTDVQRDDQTSWFRHISEYPNSSILQGDIIKEREYISGNAPPPFGVAPQFEMRCCSLPLSTTSIQQP
nr:hypothetical protein BgiMline_005227 [Biomphalaria glabrata]